MPSRLDLQLSLWTDMQMSVISEVFYHHVNSLNRATGTVCSTVFLLDKKRSVMTSSLLSRSVSAGKLDKTMQNNTVWCNAKGTH